MKKVFEKIKDILYASVDYLIMLSIVVAVVLIIGWRLDILFQKDVLASVPANPIETERENQKDNAEIDMESNDEGNERDKLEDEDIENFEDEDLELREKVENNTLDDIEDEQKNTEDINVKNIQVEIPSGAIPSEIAFILKSKKLIDDEAEFVQKSMALGLDTKFKAGTFSIPENSSMEKIADIISK